MWVELPVQSLVVRWAAESAVCWVAYLEGQRVAHSAALLAVWWAASMEVMWVGQTDER